MKLKIDWWLLEAGVGEMGEGSQNVEKFKNFKKLKFFSKTKMAGFIQVDTS